MQSPADPRQFRNALAAFATGVTVVTTRGPRGELVGNTANSFNAVSLEPPLVLWSLGKSALSFKAYLSTDHFAVNVLREGQEELSARFATAGSTGKQASRIAHAVFLMISSAADSAWPISRPR